MLYARIMRTSVAFLALRGWFAASFVLAWNTLLLGAYYLNGWQSRPLQPLAQWIVACVLFSTGALAIAILLSERIRRFLMHPERIHLYEPYPYLIVVVATVVLGGTALFGNG